MAEPTQELPPVHPLSHNFTRWSMFPVSRKGLNSRRSGNTRSCMPPSKWVSPRGVKYGNKGNQTYTEEGRYSWLPLWTLIVHVVYAVRKHVRLFQAKIFSENSGGDAGLKGMRHDGKRISTQAVVRRINEIFITSALRITELVWFLLTNTR